MANVTKKLSQVHDRWPTGTSVALYKRAQLTRDGAISGTAVSTASVQADGTVSFANVPDDGGGYVAVANGIAVQTGADAAVSWAARR